jgi:DNA-binding NtrC family response regulator
MPSLQPGAARRRYILVVDDEQEIVDLLREYLEKDHDVVAALDGASALDLVRAKRPDLILLDYAMPGINGVDVLKAVKEIDASIPVIMITANPENAIAAEALRRGAFSFFPKPFDLRYLDHLTAAALRGPTR